MKFSYKKLCIILSVLLFFIVASLPAQKINDNIIKVNVPALFFKNFSFQYEKALGKKQSFAIAIRYRPTGYLPLKGIIEDIVDDTSFQINLTKIGNLGITAEYRFYLGKKGIFRGIYLAPLASYNHYTGDIPVNYDDYDETIMKNVERIALFKGNTNTLTIGFQLGVQWKLSDNFFLDWWIVGPNYGFCKGDFYANGPISDNGQLGLEIRLKELIKPSLPLDIMKDIQVANSGASFKTSGPWAGIRAFGINLGYRF